MMCRRATSLCLAVVLASATVAMHDAAAQASQLIDDTLQVMQLPPTFGDAAAIGSDPFDNLYVVDRRRNTVSRFAADSDSVTVFGGPGSRGGQFDAPADIDATTGFLFLVADAGNGRVQRLGTDFVFLESLSVGKERGAQSSGRIDHQFELGSSGDLSDIRPVALTSSPDGNVFAIDSTTGHILQWNRNRQLVNVIGRGLRKQSWQPADLFASGNRLFVANNGANVVAVFDLFGNELYTFGNEVLHQPIAIKEMAGRVIVLDSNRLVFFTRRGDVGRITTIPLEVEVVDFESRGGFLYLITTTRLFRGRPD